MLYVNFVVYIAVTILLFLGIKRMTDKIDAAIARVEAQNTITGSMGAVIDVLLEDRAATKAKVDELTTALGEAADDNEQLASLNAHLDEGDATIAGLRDKLAAAVTANTPAEGEEDTTVEDNQ